MTLGLTIVLLALIEGGASLVIFAHGAVTGPAGIAEARSTSYDPLLGWVADPNLDFPDFYGPGRGLRTESHGFRSSHEVTEGLDPGRVRIVCSGDSFTLGYGVDNDSTWCHLLGQLMGVETVNMGQGGYGVDQAYLWYARDGLELDHQIHLFAFIEEDFDRAQRTEFFGYPKPVLEVVDGELAVANEPVPPNSLRRRLTRRLAVPLAETRLVRLIGGLRARITEEGDTQTEERNTATVEVLAVMFDELAQLNEEKSSRLILVHLPIRAFHLRVDESFWQRSVRQLSDSLGITFVDLAPMLQALPGPVSQRLFNTTDGHYSEEGNRWVAELLRTELVALPELAGSDTADVGH